MDSKIVSLLPDFLHLQKVVGDGNCFFRAISRSYKDVTGTFIHHSSLRQNCVQHIIHDPDLRNSFFDDYDLQSYTDGMLCDGTYADELCIRSLASLLKIQICVYTPEHGMNIFGNSPDPNTHPIRIAHNGINHFDSVLFRQSPVADNRQYFSFRASEKLQQVKNVSNASLVKPVASQSSQPEPTGAVELPQLPSLSQQDLSHKIDQGNKGLTILSANVTSWEPHAHFLLECGADILVLQETRLSNWGIQTHTNSLSKREHPWSSIWGKPPQQITAQRGFAKRSTGKSSHGGVGILAKTPVPLIRTGFDSIPGQTLHQSSRWCAAAIPIGPVGAMSCRFIHLISFYGVTNRGNGAKHSQNNLLLQSLFEYASSLGNQPVLICMDANTTIDKSTTLQRALTTGRWHDVAAAMSEGSPPPTFCASASWNKLDYEVGATRPDYIIANAPAMAMITHFEIRRDLPIKGHLGLQVTIRRELCMLKHRVFIPPTVFAPDNFEALSAEGKNEMFMQAFMSVREDFHKALTDHRTNDALSLLAKTGEKI